MAFLTLTQCLLVGLLVAVFATEAYGARRFPPGRRGGSAGKGGKSRGGGGFGSFGCAADNDVNKNITALWSHVKFLSQPIEVHVHEDHKKCDDYFGCDFLDHHDHHSAHGHHGSHPHSPHGGKGKSKGGKAVAGKGGKGKHASHKHGSHKHGSHKHGSHKHGSHKHASSHDHHMSHEPSFKDNHIHIHLSVNNKDDCGFVSYHPKDEFVYARCDMVEEKKSGISGSILMRQKPHGILESKIHLKGFKGPSEGIKDGKHDFFFDVHDKADFSDGCKTFGEHEHVHHDDGKFDHKHDHKHEHDEKEGHNHKHHDGHDHSVHDHHAHEDDWGNVIINKKGIANMEVNCTHHELYGPESMFGRGIVLHDKNDKIVSCCAITHANIDDEAWDKL